MHRFALTAAVAVVAVLAAAGSALADVYTLTNSASGNAVAVFHRAGNGSLTPAGTVLTGGNGTGAGLGTQGALALDGNRLVAVNAGSNTVSLFRVDGWGLGLRDIEPSGGVQPVSATIHGNLVYVLNGGGSAANITGFWIWHDRLLPVPGSTRPLSSAAPGPAQVQFSPDGRRLVVTEKSTNLIDTYSVGVGGVASGPTTTPSAAGTPFGFAFDNKGRLFVSEATLGDVSSYSIAPNGTVSAISPVVIDHQAAPCWVAVSDNGKFAYAANAHTNTLSGFAIGKDGSLSLLNTNGITATTGNGPLDLAFSDGSHYLYVLASGPGAIDAFRVNNDGSLSAVGAFGTLAAGAAGLVAN